MSILTCPNCKSTLEKAGKVYKCINRHSFDLSKEGYLNLLLPNQKKKQNPGDNKTMTDARDAFLESGHYDFLIDHIEKRIRATNPNFSENEQGLTIVDLGCGTGYYTRNIFKDTEVLKIGIDISKQGVSKAAKRDKQSLYLVESLFDLTLIENSIDLILNIFSPLHLSETERVLKTNGLLVKVIPGEAHMKEIASLVYDTVNPHHSTFEQEIKESESLKLIENTSLEKQLKLKGDELKNIIRMTPYFYKFKGDELDKLEELDISISFKVIIARLT